MRALALAIILAAAVQGPPQAPPRAAPVTPTVGSASIIGTVVTDDANARPIRRAVVSIQVPGAAYSSRMTSTDDDGRFALVGLPAGTYGAPNVSKPGYVAKTFGAVRYGAIGTPITLSDGQVMRVDFRLMRGAVITGTVFDQGRPSPQVSINVMRVREVNGVRTPEYAGVGSVQTDDRGAYRAYGLPPGDYVVSAVPRNFTAGEVRTITGADIEWAQRQFQSGAVMAAPDSPSAPPAPGPAVTYSPVYYPGVTTSAAAGLVTLGPGQERSGIDLTMRLVATARVEGVVLDLNGELTDNAQINLVPRTDMNSMESMMLMETMFFMRPVVTGGQFTLVGVRPGDYTLVIRGAAKDAGGPGPRPAGRGAAAVPMPLWASTELKVDGADITGLVMRLAPGIDLKGRIEFEEGSTVKRPEMDTIRVRLVTPPGPSVVVGVNIPNAIAQADGTFTLTGATPGRYLISASGTPAPWIMKSARIGDTDIDAADLPFDLMEHRSSEIVVTFTDKAGELSGTLFDSNNKPSSQLSIILFPTNPAMWNSRSRRLRAPVRASTEGKFKFTNLLEGEYFLAALADFEQADVYKAEFLEQVAAAAMKVTIGPGEKKVQDLRIAR